MAQEEEPKVPYLQGLEEREIPGDPWTGERLAESALKPLDHLLGLSRDPVSLELHPFLKIRYMACPVLSLESFL